MSNVYTSPIFVPTTEVGDYSGGSDPKSIVNFYEVMQYQMLADYVDPEGTITYKGISVSGEDKYGLQGTTLFTQMSTDYKNIIETVMSIETNLMSLEKDAGRMLGG